MPALFHHGSNRFRSLLTRVGTLSRKTNFRATFVDGAFFGRTEVTNLEESEHRISSPVISSPVTILTTEADGTLPVQLSITETDKSSDRAFNLIARLSTIRTVDSWLDLKSDVAEDRE